MKIVTDKLISLHVVLMVHLAREELWPANAVIIVSLLKNLHFS